MSDQAPSTRDIIRRGSSVYVSDAHRDYVFFLLESMETILNGLTTTQSFTDSQLALGEKPLNPGHVVIPAISLERLGERVTSLSEALQRVLSSTSQVTLRRK